MRLWVVAPMRKRWPPSMGEFKKMVAVVAAELPSGTVTDIFHAVKRRCPEWVVTPHRVRKALTAITNSKKKAGKKGSGAHGSKDGAARVFPHDVVELRPHAARARHAQCQWRGQVLRVAGYDDGEATDEDEDLPPSHSSVFWLGQGLEQWPNALTKESSVRVLDRPWVLGDRVAKAEDPRSLGTIVGVNCRLRFSGVPGPTEISPEVPVQHVRAVGGFRAEDWVAHEPTRWVGKVEEAVYRVEVELCRRSEQRATRSKGRSKAPLCVFQVSSEGLQGLEPAAGEDVTPQELAPHFPGQRLKAPARLWRQAEWLRGSLGRRSPRRGASICGIVSSVDCCLVAVRWLAGVSKDTQPPDEWVTPGALRTLTIPNSSEGWAIGDHVQCPPSWNCLAAVIVESRTDVDVRWSNGVIEEGVNSLRLCPRPHISAHDFLPHDFVTRSDGGDSFGMAPQVAGPASITQPTIDGEDVSIQNQDEPLYGEAAEMNTAPLYGLAHEAVSAGTTATSGEILPMSRTSQADPVLGVVTSVNLQARTAVVVWTSRGAAPESEEVSVFELTDHPHVDVRLGDAVLVQQAQDLQWTGRVCALRADGSARVELLDGSSQWHDVRRLVVVDDGEESQAADEGDSAESQIGSEETRSDGALSEISEEVLEAAETDTDGEEFAEAREEPQEDATGAMAEEEAERLMRSFESPRSFRMTDGDDNEDEEVPVERGQAADAMQRHDESDPMSPDAGVASAATASSSGGLSGEGGSSSSSSSPFGPSAPSAFDAFDEDMEPSDHHFLTDAPLATRQLMAAVRREMVVLRKGLAEGPDRGSAAPIIVRAYSSRSDLFRCMVVGPPGTPYALVPFFFDLALPAEYPREPPLAHFHAHYVGNERLNPNLYVDGKVCLSLLGTWSGPAWDPQRSTLLQVLVSLQGLVLVEEPYFNEPGHECDVGTEQGRQSSNLYNEHARLLALRAALNSAQSPPRGFEEIVARFFVRVGPQLLEECEKALQEPGASKSSEGFRKVLAKSVLPRLRDRWGSSGASGGGSGTTC